MCSGLEYGWRKSKHIFCHILSHLVLVLHPGLHNCQTVAKQSTETKTLSWCCFLALQFRSFAASVNLKRCLCAIDQLRDKNSLTSILAVGSFQAENCEPSNIFWSLPWFPKSKNLGGGEEIQQKNSSCLARKMCSHLWSNCLEERVLDQSLHSGSDEFPK